MARLPRPGGDKGNWGVILNDYLSQTLDAGGDLKNGVVDSVQLVDNAVTSAKIAPGAVTKATVGLSNADNTSDVNKPVSTAQQTALDAKADSAAVAAKLNISDLDAQTATKITTSGTAVNTALAGNYVLTFNPARYGALADGSHDDTSALNAAIAAASAAAPFVAGGAVVTLSGTYKITASVAAKSNVTVRSLAGGAKLVATGSVTTAMILGSSGDAVTRFVLDGVELDGGYATTSIALNGVQITNGSDNLIVRSKLGNLGAAGILFQGSGASGGTPRSKVVECAIDGTGLSDGTTGHGIWFKDASTDCFAYSNTLRNIKGGMGIAGSGSGGTGYPLRLNICGNNVSMQSSTTGFEGIGLTAGCDYAIVNNNQIFDTYDNGISLTSAYSEASGNIINGCYNHGIASGGVHNRVTDNLVINPGKENPASGFAGVTVYQTSDNTIALNRTLDNQGIPSMGYGVKVVQPGVGYVGRNVFTGNVSVGHITAAYTGLSSTLDQITDPNAHTDGATYSRIYTDTINAATGTMTIGSSTRFTSGNIYIGSSTLGSGQVNIATNLAASRPNATFTGVNGQAADVWQGITYSALNAPTVVAGLTPKGHLYANDGVQSKDVGAIDGLTSAQIDALFAVTPGNGTYATGTLSGNPVALFRRNNKWNVTAALTVIA